MNLYKIANARLRNSGIRSTRISNILYIGKALVLGLTIIASSIFIVTLVFVIWQPKDISIGWTACIGAALALLLGVVDFGDIADVTDVTDYE